MIFPDEVVIVSTNGKSSSCTAALKTPLEAGALYATPDAFVREALLLIAKGPSSTVLLLYPETESLIFFF